MSLNHSDIFSIIDNMKETYDEAILFKEGFDKSLLPSCLVSYNGRFQNVNQALCDYFGYSKLEMLHLDWPKLTVKSFLETDLKNVKNCLAKEIDRYKMYKEYIRKDKTVLPSLLYTTIIREYSVFYSQIIPFERNS